MAYIFLVLWAIVGLVYLILSLDHQFKNKGIARLPPNYWWEWIIMAPFFSILVILVILWDFCEMILDVVR